MTQNWTERSALSGFNASTIAVIIAVSGMWLATAADQVFHLGWGWDQQILWVAPIIVVSTMLLRFVGQVIFRWVGVMPPRAP